MKPLLDIVSVGMVTAVGLDAPSSCAAMRARLDGFQETRFKGSGRDWLIGAPIVLPRDWIGEQRYARLAAAAIEEALDATPSARGNTSLILCLAEQSRPGRPYDDHEEMLRQINLATDSGFNACEVVAHGRPSAHVALNSACKALAQGSTSYVMIAGVDTYFTSPAIEHYLNENRLAPVNSNGFIAGEAAAAILCAPPGRGNFGLCGLGLTREPVTIRDSEILPFRGDGMTAAYNAAFQQAGIEMNQLGYRIADLVGEPYWFKQTALASLRLLRGRHDFQDLWSPAESLGNVGAAVGPVMIGMAWTSVMKQYSAGNPVLIEASNDVGACGAAVFCSRAAQ